MDSIDGRLSLEGSKSRSREATIELGSRHVVNKADLDFIFLIEIMHPL